MNSDQMRRGLNETCDSLLVESLKGAFPRTGSVFQGQVLPGLQGTEDIPEQGWWVGGTTGGLEQG